MTRNTFNSGQKYRRRMLPVIFDSDLGLFYLIHRQRRHRRLERNDASLFCLRSRRRWWWRWCWYTVRLFMTSLHCQV